MMPEALLGNEEDIGLSQVATDAPRANLKKTDDLTEGEQTGWQSAGRALYQNNLGTLPEDEIPAQFRRFKKEDEEFNCPKAADPESPTLEEVERATVWKAVAAKRYHAMGIGLVQELLAHVQPQAAKRILFEIGERDNSSYLPLIETQEAELREKRAEEKEGKVQKIVEDLRTYYADGSPDLTVALNKNPELRAEIYSEAYRTELLPLQNELTILLKQNIETNRRAKDLQRGLQELANSGSFAKIFQSTHRETERERLQSLLTQEQEEMERQKNRFNDICTRMKSSVTLDPDPTERNFKMKRIMEKVVADASGGGTIVTQEKIDAVRSDPNAITAWSPPTFTATNEKLLTNKV